MEKINEGIVIDESSGEAVTPKHAILIDCINNFTDDEYCEAVGSIIGSNNIRFLNRDNGKMKIYLNYLSLVKRIVQSGIWIGGEYQNVNYNDLDSTKLLLSNVQYEIPNNLLKEKLSMIGEVTSDIIIMKAEVSNPAYAHVLSATRSVHVKIDPGTTIPHSVEVIFGGRQYEILIQCDVMLTSSDATEQDLPMIYPSQNSPKKYAMNQKGGDGLSPALPRKRGRPARQGLQGKVAKKNLKQGTGLATRKKRRYKKVNFGSKRMAKGSSVRQRISGEKCTLMSTATTFAFSYDQMQECTDGNCKESDFANEKEDLAAEDKCNVPFLETVAQLSESFNGVDNDICDSLANDDDTSEMDLCNAVEDTSKIIESSDSSVPQYPLSLLSLRRFLKDAKNNRNPFEVAMKVLEECDTPGAVNLLCNQLIEYHRCVHERSLQNRICRLVNILSGGEKDI